MFQYDLKQFIAAHVSNIIYDLRILVDLCKVHTQIFQHILPNPIKTEHTKEKTIIFNKKIEQRSDRWISICESVNNTHCNIDRCRLHYVLAALHLDNNNFLFGEELYGTLRQ